MKMLTSINNKINNLFYYLFYVSRNICCHYILSYIIPISISVIQDDV